MSNFVKRARENRVVITLIVVLLLFASLIMLTTDYATVYAENKDNNFDKTALQAELESIEGFDFGNYPADPSGMKYSARIFNVVEYAYSYQVNKRNNYGLYIYLYNPQLLKIDITSRRNKVNLGVKLNTANNITTVSEYDKYELKYCSSIDDGAYKDLFYKFKVVDKKGADGNMIHQRVDLNERRYDIAEIELLHSSMNNAEAFKVGGSYKFTGFSKGYGSDATADSTLSSSVVDLETIELNNNIGSTSYVMPWNNSNGEGHYDMINSVYFSVPNRIMTDYGSLQRVKFETYECKSSPIIVTKNQTLYNDIYADRSKLLNGYNKDKYGLAYGIKERFPVGAGAGEIYKQVDWGYNVLHNNDENYSAVHVTNNANHLPYVFYKEYGDKTTDVTSAELLKYASTYNASNFNGYLNHRDITKDLFMGNVFENGHSEGYYKKEIDASISYNLYEQNITNGWTGFWDNLFNIKPDERLSTLKPIEKVININDMNSLYVGESDKENFATAYNKSVAENRSMHMFRFSITDYFTTLLKKTGGLTGFRDAEAYLAEASVFLDFDIITLTFNKEGIYRVIPVVMSPIDIYPGITSPDVSNGLPTWLMWVILIMSLILLFVLLILFYPLIKVCVKAVATVVSIPFKSIGSIGKKAKKSKEKMTSEIANTKPDKLSKHKTNHYGSKQVEKANKRMNRGG